MSEDQIIEDELLATPPTPEEMKPLPGTQPDVPDIKIKRIISGKDKKTTMLQITVSHMIKTNELTLST